MFACTGLTHKYQARPERLARVKHSSLIDLFISDKEISFIIFAPKHLKTFFFVTNKDP
jgi:hypothetical protein